MSRIDDVPCYAQRNDEVSARLYNLWRRAKLHFGCPIRIVLKSIPGMVMILESDRWVCADARQYDLPVLAWVNFNDNGRDALHTPVDCLLNYYHFAASKVRLPVLTETEFALAQRLQEDGMIF